MNIEATLRKEGIEVVKQLDTLKVNSIAQKITNRLCSTFPEHGFSRAELFASISRLNMYLAKMDDNLCGAKYYYKNKSIYFNINFSLNNVDLFSLHECLHYLQEVTDNKGNLVRLGLYDFSKNCGMAINEAATQLMVSDALQQPIFDVKYYNLTIPSNSPDYYPLECTILKQMSYFTGSYPLYYSTLNGNDIFQNTFITIAGEKSFNTISSNLDKMLYLENNLSEYINTLKYCEDNIKKVKKLNSIIDNTKKEIASLFMSCQNIIISQCFTSELKNIRTMEDIKNLKNKLYDFKSFIGTNESYTFYNDFYRNMMDSLDNKTKHIEENGPYDFQKILNSEVTVISNTKKSISILRKMLYKLGLLGQKGF